MLKRSRNKLAMAAVAALLGFASSQWLPARDSDRANSASTSQLVDQSELAARAFKQRQANIWLGVRATVSKILKDDTKGIRHQKFIINLANDMSLLVAHNIDLAPRVPIALGDSIYVRGRYEWNQRGGLLHWTHHDPADKASAAGFIELKGKRYH